MHLLFSYGTLRLPGVQAAVFGRPVPCSDDALPGFRVEEVLITDPAVLAASGMDRHPILCPGAEDDLVAGGCLELDDDDLAAADAYEVDDYTRIEVTLASGRRAWVYVGAEQLRAARLVDAQRKAVALFDEIGRRGLVRPGIGEAALADEIRDLAAAALGVRRHWHKRIVRSGENTLTTARDTPADRVLGADDIVFIDLGPIFEEWEADFARTYVLGEDPGKLAICDALPQIWAAARAHFEATPDITGEQLFEQVVALSRAAGWDFGGAIAGHLVGEFPHEKIRGNEVDSYVAPGSVRPMRRKDRSGKQCHWILEVHLVDPGRRYGGFYEQLLDLA